MSKYQNKYRVETTRLKCWDYSKPWWYYVTINVKNHKNYFGKIINEQMVLNQLGDIVNKYWKDIPNHFSNVELDYYVIMPNHIHGIIIINPIDEKYNNRRDVACNVSTTTTGTDKNMSDISPKKGSLSVIIRSFKSAVTKYAIENGIENFSWQERFYDRIIRSEKELFNIRKYIEQNPLRWQLERNTTEDLGI